MKINNTITGSNFLKFFIAPAISNIFTFYYPGKANISLIYPEPEYSTLLIKEKIFEELRSFFNIPNQRSDSTNAKEKQIKIVFRSKIQIIAHQENHELKTSDENIHRSDNYCSAHFTLYPD